MTVDRPRSVPRLASPTDTASLIDLSLRITDMSAMCTSRNNWPPCRDAMSRERHWTQWTGTGVNASTSQGDLTTMQTAVTAVHDIVNARMQASRVKKSFKLKWAQASEEELELASSPKGGILPQHKVTLKFLQAERLAARAQRESDPLLIKRALREIYFAGAILAHSPQLSEPARFAAATFALQISRHTRIPKTSRQRLGNLIAERKWHGARPDLTLILHEIDERRLQQLIKKVSSGASLAPLASYPDVGAGQLPSTADLLAQAALRQEQEARSNITDEAKYDLSEAGLKLDSIKLGGFRGSPNEIEVNFTQKDTPVSAIIFGENGVGKSTVVDAIEFALQARISRSINFESPLTSAMRSFASDPIPKVEAKLSNDRRVVRSVTTNRSGALQPSPREVSPGFRLAPITLNRTDLQRLLDTEALERGTVLLDYFPGDLQSLPMRPEQEVHRLRSEMTDLRVRRSGFATQLGDLINEDPSELANRERFTRVIREKFMNGDTVAHFEDRGGWSTVPEEIRVAIVRLQETHLALSAAKKRSERAVEVLNPVAHAKQAKILAPILAKIGLDLSVAFSHVCHDYPVNRIDVVFGSSGPVSLDFVVQLENGRTCYPQQIFSEAYKDLIALLFFTSVAKEAAERGQARILILDDVLQSIDSGIRHEFMSYMLSEFADWQLIVTVHDRLWRQQLRALFDANDHTVVDRTIHRWTFLGGPELSPPDFDEFASDLRMMLDTGQPRTIGALAGQLLEMICDRATVKLRLPVRRNDGDRYTMGDLWPPLQQRLAGTAAQGEVRAIATHKAIRNLTVHSDPLSWNLSLADAQAFAKATLSLYSRLRCTACRSWAGEGKQARCSCGSLTL